MHFFRTKSSVTTWQKKRGGVQRQTRRSARNRAILYQDEEAEGEINSDKEMVSGEEEIQDYDSESFQYHRDNARVSDL